MIDYFMYLDNLIKKDNIEIYIMNQKTLSISIIIPSENSQFNKWFYIMEYLRESNIEVSILDKFTEDDKMWGWITLGEYIKKLN